MFQEELTKLKINLTQKQLDQFAIYYQFLVEYNKITNLTAITEEKDVYYKHFYDSLLLTQSVDFNKILKMCDIGAGAGFPSIPIKIIYPHLEITIVDSLGKRIKFLEQLIEKLSLEKVILRHSRAEDHALKNLSSYDLVSARAVGHLAIILELGVPMLKVGGYFLAPKGQNYLEEITESKNAISVLKVKKVKTDVFELPFEYGMRANILFQKEKEIKGYPRPYAQISKKRL